MSDQVAPLPQGAGYAVVVGLGFVFAIGMVATTFALKRYNKEIMTAEEFATAGRSVKTGLIAAAVVSSWTWSATLLTSTSQVYRNGVSGSIFYAAGATAQITLFACLAIKARERAPAAHTYLEIVKGRYGTVTHCVYIFWGFCTNILVTVMLLAGGSATVNDLTGMHPVAACLLIPLGVVVYTLFGGIKATILTDYAHNVVMIVVIMIFGFVVWATSSMLGSPGAVWELVTAYAEANPREGNSQGSYLTLRSRSGGMFFVINIIGNFGTVFLDNGYFNKAFSANPVSSYRGYILGSLAWLPVPAFTSLTMGLAALALNLPLSDSAVAAGLVLPNAASALLGQAGAVLALIMVFMAVTSAMSSELIAVSTIATYDIYRTYINPEATGKKLIWYSHVSVIIFAYSMAGFAIGLYYAEVAMGYLYEMMGVIIGGAVLSSTLTILSKKQNWHAATFTPIISTSLAIMAWLVCTKTQTGSVNYLNTFLDDPMLTGNCVALLSPIVIIPVLTFVFKPQNFDWKLLDLRITRVDEDEELAEALGEVEDPENLSPVKSQISVIASQLVESERDRYAEERATMKKAFKLCVIICVTITICLLVLFPMPMYGTGYVFSKPFFTGWVVVFFLWLWYSIYQVVVYPIYEGRHELYHTFRGIYWDLTGQTYKLRAWQNEHPEEMHAVRSQLQAQLSGTATSHNVVDGKAFGDGYTTPAHIDSALDDEKKG
ncbi:Urea active transporter [Candida viswanathii]|uniref:Urea active transporter n=1 Tax=Candida viswanathii TaxID=5486 RepID=A0A367XQC9_9ASCO|nr:Urea active transporter [Candida viswanathii]